MVNDQRFKTNECDSFPPGPADISEYRHILYLFTFISSQRWQITKCTQEWFLVFRFWETLGELWHQRLQNMNMKNIWSPWFVKNHKKSIIFQSILCWRSWDLTYLKKFFEAHNILKLGVGAVHIFRQPKWSAFVSICPTPLSYYIFYVDPPAPGWRNSEQPRSSWIIWNNQ